MGLSAEAIIGHSVRADQLDDLPLRFAPGRAPRLARATSALEALTAPHKPVTGWTISPEEPLAVPLASAWDHDELPTLKGPGIDYGHMARHTLTIGPGLRWMRPLSENPLFLAAHGVAAALAAALDSPLVLWIDDANLPKLHGMGWAHTRGDTRLARSQCSTK